MHECSLCITVDIFKHTDKKKNEKPKRADQILPEVYGTTLTRHFIEVPVPVK
jgi:hypothetical protein